MAPFWKSSHNMLRRWLICAIVRSTDQPTANAAYEKQLPAGAGVDPANARARPRPFRVEASAP